MIDGATTADSSAKGLLVNIQYPPVTVPAIIRIFCFS
jgi:hypothetical protein